MSDAVWSGPGFCALKVIAEFNLEDLRVDEDTNLPETQLVKTSYEFVELHDAPDLIRLDNGQRSSPEP